MTTKCEHPAPGWRRGLSVPLALAAAAVFGQTQEPPSQGAVTSAVGRSADAWSARQRVYLSPGVAEDIASGLHASAVAACWGDRRQCERAKDVQELASVVTAYLDALLANPIGVDLPGDRLLARIGFDKSRLGWPTGPAVNRYLVLGLPEALTTFSYTGWNGARRLPPAAVRVLVAQGVHGFVATEASSGRVLVADLLARRDAVGAIVQRWRSEPVAGRAHGVPWRAEPELARFCLDKPVDPTEPKYRLATGRGAPGIAAASEFHSAEILRVQLQADQSQCGDDCQAWVAMSVLQALSQWRAGCSRCAESTLSVVEIGAATYLAVRYLEPSLQLPHLQSRGSSAAGGPMASDQANMALTQGAGVNARMGFQRIDGREADLGVCSVLPVSTTTAGFTPLSVRARERICTNASKAACIKGEGCKEIPMRISGGPDCANALACGFPDQSVTLNTPRFRFALLGADAGRPPAVTLGRGTLAQQQEDIPLHPVILHEVGHWFGLPHVESDVGSDGRDEVMVDFGGTDKVCISRAALNMVDSAVDRSWSLRQSGRGALRYEPR